MKAKKKVRKSTPKRPTARRKLANKVNRSLKVIRKVSKRGQKKIQKKKNITRTVRMINNQLTVSNATNEEKIVKLVKKLLGDESIDEVAGCEADVNLLQDLDLLVLGSSQEEYKCYQELLRKEYSHLDDSSYKQMRLKNDAQHPSTSGQSTSRNNRPNKPFIKFKDDKARYYPDKHLLVKKYKANKRSLQSLSRFPITSAPSPSQLVSRKILRTIRKRRLPLGEHIPNKTPARDTSKEIHKDFQKIPLTTESKEIDDDCVCIEAPPEVILIDDETIIPIVGIQEDNDTNQQKLKPYEPIGSIRSSAWPSSSMEMLTSTPKFNGFPFKGGPLGDIVSPSLSRIEDCTLREKDDNGSTVIVIDDTVVPSINRSNGRKKRRHDTDDSVIFVCENVASDGYQPTRAQPTYANVVSDDCLAPEFIPLVTPADESQYKVKWVEPTPATTPKRSRNDLFSSKEQKQNKVYNENAYNPNGDDPALHTKKRMVIIDGSNVAYQHALNKEFSVKGLKICLDYFEKMGHDAKAVVPQFRLRTQKSSDPSGLEKLHKDGKIVFTPCKNLPGKTSISYDDRFVLQLATELDAAVVSNDNYRDLINENPAFKKIIENRVIGYTWCNDLFILPKDPYGKWGPTLATILNRS